MKEYCKQCFDKWVEAKVEYKDFNLDWYNPVKLPICPLNSQHNRQDEVLNQKDLQYYYHEYLWTDDIISIDPDKSTFPIWSLSWRADDLGMNLNEYMDYIIDSYVNWNQKKSFKMFQEFMACWGYEEFMDNLSNYSSKEKENYLIFIISQTYG